MIRHSLFTGFVLLFIKLNAQGAIYPYAADLGDSGVRNGSNDVSVRISIRADGATLGTNAVAYRNVPTTNGIAILSIALPEGFSGIKRYIFWLEVRESGSTNTFSVLPLKKLRLEKGALTTTPQDPLRALLIVAMLCLVVFETRKRFIVPSTDRYSTTRSKYEMAAALYSFIWFLPFFTFLYFPEVLSFALGKELGSIQALPIPLVAGIAAIYLLPKVKKVQEFDKWIQSRLRQFAEIPAQLDWLHDACGKANFHSDLNALALVLNLPPAGQQEALIQYGLSPTQSPNMEWARAANLYAKLAQLKCNGRYVSFFENDNHGWAAIEAGFNECLQLATAAKHDIKFTKLHREVRMFAARLVLFCGMTEKGRRDILHEGLGLEIKTTVERVSFHQITFVFLLLLSIALVGLLIFTGHVLEPVETKLLRGLMISLIYTCSVAAAVYVCKSTSNTPKRMWFAYLLGSVASMIVAYTFSFAFGVINFDGDVGAALINSYLKYPYLFSAGVTCFCTCFMLDTKVTPRFSRKMLLGLESFGGFLIGLGLALLIWFLLNRKLDFLIATNSVLVALLNVPPLVSLCFIFAGLNASIAALVPYWFREPSTLEVTQTNSSASRSTCFTNGQSPVTEASD